MKITAINEESLLIKFSDEISEKTHFKVKSCYDYLMKQDVILSVVPSYNSVLVIYDLLTTDYYTIKEMIESLDISVDVSSDKTIVKIPVCYDMGPDLKRVAEHTRLSEQEVIKRHISTDYLIYMIGFTPGFPYLGGLDPALETPRLEVPRTRIDGGSVGIGGKQTGVYPLAAPGGWNIIGRTPLNLYDEQLSETLLKMGQYVRFYPVDESEYKAIRLKVESNEYKVEVITC